MKWFVYILHSTFLCRYYVGISQNLQRRIKQHRYGNSFWTRRANDWKFVFQSKAMTREHARQMELVIKKRGAERYLRNQQIYHDFKRD